MHELEHALRNLRRHGGRSLAAIAMVMCGVAASIAVAGAMAFLFENYREVTIHSQYGHLQIARKGYFDNGLEDGGALLVSKESVRVDALHTLPHVVRIAPKLHFSGFISRPGAGAVSFTAEGVDPIEDFTLKHGLTLLAGSMLSKTASREVMLGQGLAKNLGTSPGDTVVLLVATTTGGINALEARVGGVFASMSKSYDDAALKIPIDVARELIRTAGASVWSVLLDSTGATDSALESVRARLGDRTLEVKPWFELAEFYRKAVDLIEGQVAILKMIIAAVILLGVANTAAMNVLERTAEIGMCVALGMRRSKIMRSFLLEGAMIGVLGALAGVLLAYGVAALVGSLHIQMPPPPGMAHGYTAGIEMTAAVLASGIALGILSALGGSFYPAWRASRLSVVEALRTAQ